jgi:hypothetical protein
MNAENNIESPECRVVVSSTAIVRRLLELPPETEIQQPDGIWRRLTDNEYESANHTDTIYGDGMPFWVQGWRDLHHRLRVPENTDLQKENKTMRDAVRLLRFAKEETKHPDTIRLDWLDNWGFEYAGMLGAWCIGLPDGQSGNTRDIREAIDAAMPNHLLAARRSGMY